MRMGGWGSWLLLMDEREGMGGTCRGTLGSKSEEELHSKLAGCNACRYNSRSGAKEFRTGVMVKAHNDLSRCCCY